MVKFKRLTLVVFILCAILPYNVRADEAEKGLYAYFLNVGQGDATVIVCDGKVMMIDGGDGDAVHSQFINSFLRNTIGIDTIDVMIATHSHSDHIGGLPCVLDFYNVYDIYTPTDPYNNIAWKTIVESADKKGITILKREAGDQFKIGGASVSVLGPVFLPSDERDKNNTSLVFRVDYGNTSFLFMGDAELEEEHDILDTGADLHADVLHVSHHGSEDGTFYLFLRTVDPSYGIISVGKGNPYGHPHEKTLSLLKDADVTVFRTDQSGSIMCYSDGTDISFTEFYK